MTLIYEPRRDGLRLYRDGEHVGTIPYDDLGRLVLVLAMMMQHRPDT